MSMRSLPRKVKSRKGKELLRAIREGLYGRKDGKVCPLPRWLQRKEIETEEVSKFSSKPIGIKMRRVIERAEK